MSVSVTTDLRSRILDAVVELTEASGYDGWSLAGLAKHARLSLRDVYKEFPGESDMRRALIAAALRRWLAEHTHRDLQVPSELPLADALTWMFRRLFEPWEDHPRLLEAYQIFARTPVGRELEAVGLAPFRAAWDDVVGGLDPGYAADLGETLGYVTLGLFTAVVRGEMTIAEMLPALDRTVRRLTSDNSGLAQRRA